MISLVCTSFLVFAAVARLPISRFPCQTYVMSRSIVALDSNEYEQTEHAPLSIHSQALRLTPSCDRICHGLGASKVIIAKHALLLWNRYTGLVAMVSNEQLYHIGDTPVVLHCSFP